MTKKQILLAIFSAFGPLGFLAAMAVSMLTGRCHEEPAELVKRDSKQIFFKVILDFLLLPLVITAIILCLIICVQKRKVYLLL